MVALALLSSAIPATAAEPTQYQRALAAGYKAAMLCSGMFNAGRTQAQVEALELTGIYPEYQAIIPTLKAQVDKNWVFVPFDQNLPPRQAFWTRDRGCITSPIGADDGAVREYLPDMPPQRPLDGRAWPVGDRAVVKSNPTMTALFNTALKGDAYGKGARTIGLIVAQDGKIVSESYAEGFSAVTSNRTWSVAKSISGTLIGIAAKQKIVDPVSPAKVPEWNTFLDARHGITLDNLLRMASGLHSDTAGNRTDALYTGATTVTQETTHWPLEAKPGTRFRYANNDILLAIRSLRASLNNDERYWAFPRTELFDRIGMRHTVAETDWQGNFLLSSQVWSTARDFARLGLLWLNDGVWQGERILPEGWMTYMTTPSGPQPADGPGYGATLWLFGPKQGLPEGSYAAQGNRGQYIMVVPTKRLVIVRRGEDTAGSPFDIAKFSADVIAALK